MQSELATHAFELLKFVISKATVYTSKTANASNSSSHLPYSEQEVDRVMELIETGTTQPALRDELYVHVLKQLQRNSSENARFRLWQLLAIYLHRYAHATIASLQASLCTHSNVSLTLRAASLRADCCPLISAIKRQHWRDWKRHAASTMTMTTTLQPSVLASFLRAPSQSMW